MNKKVFLQTFGCQMNVRDSEVICGLLLKEGYSFVDDPAQAEIIILNTCSVRQHAEDKVWSEIGRITKETPTSRGTRDEGRETRKILVGLVGCMAQNYKEAIFERAPNVDFAVGPSDIHKIPEIILRRTGPQVPRSTGENLFDIKIWETDGEIRPEEIYHTGYRNDKTHAYVVISEGCSNPCSYCVVPYARGPLRNRHYKEVVREIEEAVRGGITKFTLLGQNVNAYKDRDIDFIGLIKMVNALEGVREFGFITSHPKDTSVELFKAMGDLNKLRKFLHLPVQAGSDRILELMNRGYTAKIYLDLIDTYRKIIPEGALTSDIIVGFPSETEKDFQQTYDLVKAADFNAAYIFKYSPRPHTEASKMVEDISREEKERRHKLILDLQKSISAKKERYL